MPAQFPVSTYRLLNTSVNPADRFGAPETEPGPAGAENEFMGSPFHEGYCLTVAHRAAAPHR